MVKVSPFFFFAVSAPLLSIVQAGSCDLHPTIPTTCTGKDGWYPISVVGRGVYCTKGPNVCVADNSNGDCPSAQAGLEFGSKCDSLAPGVYGCFPNDSCTVSTQENAVVQSPPQTGCDVVDDGTPESDKVKTDPPTYTPTLPPVKEDGIIPSTPAPYGSRKEDAPVSSYGSPEGAPAGSPGDSPTPTPTSWMVDVPEYRSEPDSSSPAEGNTPPSYNSPGGAPTDIPALTPSGKPEDALVDTPAPTPCESTPVDVPAPTTSGKPEDALADTPAPTPCESTPAVAPAPTTSGKPEDALADTPAPTPCEKSTPAVAPAPTTSGKPEDAPADTPAPTPCESTESPADTPAPTTSEAAPSNSPAPADGPTQEQQEEAAPIDTSSAPADSPTQEQQQELVVVPTPTAENDGIDYSLDLGDRRLRH